MSVRCIDAVWKHSKSKGTARLVLLALADVAGDDGTVVAYKRSQSVLAAKANVDRSSVKRALKQLVDQLPDGLAELEVIEGGDGRRSTDYRLLLPSIEGAQDAPPEGAGCTPRGGTVHPQGAQDAPPISPSLSVPPRPSPSRSASPKRSPLPEGFAVTDAMAEWAAREHPAVDTAAETAKFVDHWTSKAERRADWVATWRNWIRNAASFQHRGRRPPPPPPRERRVGLDDDQLGELAL